MHLSRFGKRFTTISGTRQLMDDLGTVLRSGPDVINLGGGNPSVIPALQAVFHDALVRLVAGGDLDRLMAAYDGPQGHRPFLEAVAALLNGQFGWHVSPDNVLATTGSQASFFMLFNLFAGDDSAGVRRQILLPQSPEYVGYADIALQSDSLISHPSRIEYLAPHRFKYRVDFSEIALDDATAAVCISRPTNPTGNVITDTELARLVDLTAQAGLPLIVDCAYGQPFPGILFADALPVWSEHIVLCLSLSKLGLPGLRTGIVVARPDIIEALTSMSASLMLANNSIGARLVLELIQSGEVIRLSRDEIKPYYLSRAQQALACCDEYFAGLDYYIHQPEGAIFLWLWFPDLPVSAQTLYERLKARGILVLPGHHFTPGLQRPWQHAHECLRISYAQPEEVLRRGVCAIAEEVRRAVTADPR